MFLYECFGKDVKCTNLEIRKYFFSIRHLFNLLLFQIDIFNSQKQNKFISNNYKRFVHDMFSSNHKLNAIEQIIKRSQMSLRILIFFFLFICFLVTWNEMT